MKSIQGLITGVAIVALAVIGAPVASAAPVTGAEAAKQVVLEQFRKNLAEASEAGDTEAAESVESFDSLTRQQRSELAELLTGERAWEPSTNLDEEIVVERGVVPRAVAAASQTRTIWYTSAFTFAGIKVTETKVTGRYTAQGSSAKRILSNSCTVVRNFQPFTNVNTNQSASYVNGKNAVFDCRVRVQRGIPTAWGTIDWSTKEQVQTVSGNGYGTVVSRGWR